MSNKNIIRAWKDPVYRNSLSESERAALPPNPAGAIEISEADLGKIAGGDIFETQSCSLFCPTPLCSFNECSQLFCPTALPNVCPTQKKP